MDRQQIGIMLVLDGLDVPFNLSYFNDRLIYQKTVYLAQAAGINLGYYYHWYLHGPYCSPLTRDGYDIQTETASKEWEEWQLSGASRAKLADIKPIFNEQGQELADKLELLASVHFLIERKQVKDRDVKEITATLKRFNKLFSKDQVREALGELKQYGFLS